MEINSSIKCSVVSCQYNEQSKEYCTLNQIKVGTHEKNPTEIACTDCESFQVR
jgi:ribonuclease HIII